MAYSSPLTGEYLRAFERHATKNDPKRGGAHVSTRPEDSTESGARRIMRKEQSTMSKNTDLPAFEPAEITVDGDTLKIERNKDTKKSAQELRKR